MIDAMIVRTRALDRATITWLVLVVLTLATWLWGLRGVSGIALVVPAMLFALVKGRLLVDHFMEAYHASTFWRVLLGGYLMVVTAGIATAFLLP